VPFELSDSPSLIVLLNVYGHHHVEPCDSRFCAFN